MGYINQVTGYRNDLLCNRSIIKKGMYALLEPDGLVKNVIPSFQECEITILSSREDISGPDLAARASKLFSICLRDP